MNDSPTPDSMNDEVRYMASAARERLGCALVDMRKLSQVHGSRELSLAITNAEQALMWANADFFKNRQ